VTIVTVSVNSEAGERAERKQERTSRRLLAVNRAIELADKSWASVRGQDWTTEGLNRNGPGNANVAVRTLI
jgi:hypothetical protein